MLQITNEYGRLESVMVGPPDTLQSLIPINSTQNYYFFKNPPDIEIMISEHKNFVEVLRNNGVKVLWADKVPECDQRDIRDIGITIFDKFVVCRLKEKIRKGETKGLETMLTKIPQERIMILEDGLLEGGDVMIDYDLLLIGLSVRTDLMGVEFIRKHFSSLLKVTPVHIEGENSLHLDTVFNILDKNLAIVYMSAFDKAAIKLFENRYELIPISKPEQFNLATNVLSIGDRKIILDYSRNSKLADKLSVKGFSIINVKFSETNKIGGSFRCATLPLVRGS